MVLISERQYLLDRLLSMKRTDLLEFARYLGVSVSGRNADIVDALASDRRTRDKVDKFIKCKYRLAARARRSLISDEDLLLELRKVTDFTWGVVQGELDRKIQAQYVREFVRYDSLISAVRQSLHDEVTKYVICTWYNHWTTVLIEDHIFLHSRVVPALKRNVKGLDLFFDGQRFDLKITYLPRDYRPQDALADPRRLAKWLYENPQSSWKLKRDVRVVFPAVDSFLDAESVTDADEILFTFKGNTYTTHAKLLLITPSSPTS